MYLLTQRMRKRGIILIGFLLIAMAQAMIGGSDFLFQFQKQPVFIFIGLCFIGLSAGMVTIPVLPEMLESIEDDSELSHKYDMEQVANFISGMFVTYQSIGEAIGPMISSTIAEYYSFTVSQEFFAIVLLIFSFCYFSFCGNFAMFGKDTRHFGSKMQEGEDLSLIDNEINQTPDRKAGGASNNFKSNDGLKLGFHS
jgi:MFS family permease